jgi:reactive intermediate/imine deaminase
MVRVSRRVAKSAAVLAAALVLARFGLAEEPKLRYVQPPGLENTPRYSHAVVVESGRLVFVSGQIAHDASGKLVGPGDMRAQTKQVFENIREALRAAGTDFAHVVKIDSFLADMGQLDAYRDVRQQYLAGLAHPPASTTVGVTRLVSPDLLLEVDVVAVAK